MLDEFLLKFWRLSGAEALNIVDIVKSFQTSIHYLLAKFGNDTAENEPVKVRQKLAKS